MIDNSKKYAYLKRILESSEFTESKNYSDLLTYLAESSIKGKIPKETTIALKVFGKSSDFNPTEDPAVRVYLHNLRKRIAKYYEYEGKKDKIRLIIPKGHYEVKFIENKKLLKYTTQFITFPNVLILAILIILIAINIFLWRENFSVRKSYQVIKPDDPIWSEFIKSEKPPMILLGDYFFFSQQTKDKSAYVLVRDDNINSMEDLNEFNNNLPEENSMIKPSRIVLFEKNNAFSLRYISHVFYSHHINFTLQSASHLQSQDLLNYNIIYIGSFWFSGLLQQYFTKSPFKYQYRPSAKLIYSPEISDSTITFSKIGVVNYFHTDYTIIAKLPGPDGNYILLVSSFFSTGATQAIKDLSTQSTLTNIENQMLEKLGHIPMYFEIILEVTGLDRIGFSSKVVLVSELSSEMNIWSPQPLN